MFGAGGFDFGGLLEALSSLFSSGAGETAATAATGLGETASSFGDIASTAGNLASSAGGALNYPMELLGDVGGWMGNNWQPLTDYALKAGNLGLGVANQIGQQNAQQDYQKYLNQQQQMMMPQNIMSQATPARPASSLVKRTMADAQASGLSGAAPDFLARTAGFNSPNEFDLYKQGGF